MFRQLRVPRRTGIVTEPPSKEVTLERVGVRLREEIRRRFAGSLHIRQVDAGPSPAALLADLLDAIGRGR